VDTDSWSKSTESSENTPNFGGRKFRLIFEVNISSELRLAIFISRLRRELALPKLEEMFRRRILK